MKKRLTYLAATALMALALSAQAQMTPVGTWHSVDDESGKPSAEIKISDKGNGELVGVVMKSLLPPKEGDEAICSKCPDDRKDKPKLGMDIIRGAKQSAGTLYWDGGSILDPNKGKLYKLRLMPEGSGATLQVRGYIGPFFRTQTWIRVN